jgi:hemoglobin-like flavoprotein
VTSEQTKLLRQSFKLVESQATIAALVFYRNLFTLDPSLRSLFHTSIEVQGRKLMEALGYTVATLENPETLVPALEAMGRRHVAYGTRDEHYDTVLRAMMLTLEQTLGEAFAPEVRQVWSDALKFVADAMRRGAAKVDALKAETSGTNTEAVSPGRW